MSVPLYRDELMEFGRVVYGFYRNMKWDPIEFIDLYRCAGQVLPADMKDALKAIGSVWMVANEMGDAPVADYALLAADSIRRRLK